jgi:DNA polymerase I-like protein with 3'-5' exonuclease and polymerase domains
MSDTDPHAALARKLFGEVTRDTRSRAKAINFYRAYNAGEIRAGRIAGQYPLKG